MKVDEIPTWVGHGWNLEFGGVIIYNQRGRNDEAGMLLTGVYALYQQYLNGQMTGDQQKSYLDNVLKKQIDSEFDMYQFNFLGKSGEFMFRPDGTIQTSLDQGLKIIKTAVGFRITDEAGNQYFFESRESNSIISDCGNPYNPDFNDNSAYFLTRIQTINNRSVVYQYRSYPLSYNRNGTLYHHRPLTGSSCPSSDLSSICSSFELNNLLVESITFDNGEILFEHAPTARLDVRQIDPVTSLPSLNSITIKNTSGLIFGKYHFDYEYFGIDKRLKLKKLRRTNGASQVYEHVFSYLNEYEAYPVLFGRSQDHAGYFNGSYSTYLFPQTDYSFLTLWNTSLSLADRNSNFAYGKFGLLEKVVYPTGGSTTFVYEPNQMQLKSYKYLKNNSIFFDIPVNYIFDGTNIYMNNNVYTGSVSGSFTLTSETFVKISVSKQFDLHALADPEINFTGPSSTVASINNFMHNLQLHCVGDQCRNTITMVMEAGVYSYTMMSGQDFDAFPLSMWFKVEGENNKPYEVGGGRIKKIINDGGTGAGQVMEKEIVYDHNEDSINLKLRPVYIKQGATSFMDENAHVVPCTMETTVFEQPVNPASVNILYNRVTEIDKGPINIGTIVHRFKPNGIGPYSIDPFVEPQNLGWRYNEIQTIKYKNTSTNSTPTYEMTENAFQDAVSDNSAAYNTGFRVSLGSLYMDQVSAVSSILPAHHLLRSVFTLNSKMVSFTMGINP